jgi:hypothetical protein
LLIWDVETQATTKVHQAMVGNLVEPATITPQFSGYAESQIKELSNQVRDLGSNVSTIMLAQKNLQPLNQSQNSDPRNNGHESHPRQGTAEPISTCRYCEVLHHNTDRSATATATAITNLTKKDFHHTHFQFLTRDERRYVLPPNGCLQWLHTPMEIRLQAVSKKPSVCSICLCVPSR